MPREAGRLVQGIGGLLVLITASIGGAFTWEQIKVTRDGQLTDRYTKAVDQLGNDKSANTRIGGVYALDRIARNSPIDRHAIANVLNAFVLETAPLPSVAVRDAQASDARTSNVAGRDADRREGDQKVQLKDLLPLPWRRNDVQAAVDVLGQALFEGMVVLPFVDLRKAVLEEAKFVGSVFTGASLAGSVLAGADFREATLQNIDLEEANLERADLRNAKLQGANLRNANLCGADLRGAHLDGADVGGAHYDAATRWPDDRFEPLARGAVVIVGYMPRS